MIRFAKIFSMILTVLAVPVTLLMVGMIMLTTAWSNYGIRGGWDLADIVFMVCGVIYPVLAIVAFKKVRNQTESQAALAWSLMPAPVLLIIMVLLVKSLLRF